MRHIRVFTRAVALLFGLGVSCHGYALEFAITDTTGAPLANAVVSFGVAGEARPAERPAVIDQVNKRFQPHVLAVAAGQWVDFPNSDDIRHHVYSFSEAKPFEIRLYQGQPEAPIQFDEAGVVVLGCNIHDSMVGYIFVSDKPRYGVTDDRGQVAFPGAAVPDKVAIWHPHLRNNKTSLVKAIDPQSVGPVRIEIDVMPPPPKGDFRDKFNTFFNEN